MKKVRWIAQSNLISQVDRDKMEQACKDIGVEYEGVHVLPFAYGLPKFTIDDDVTNIYYGSTTFITNLMMTQLDKTGIFFDSEKYLMSNYLEQWGEHMLSSEAKVMKFHEFISQDHDPESQWFIRPNADDKSFDGEVRKFSDVEGWFNKVKNMFDNVGLDENTEILAGPAYNIRKEWRNFIVNGKVVSSSKYRQNFKLNKSADDVPPEMIEFAEARAAEYSPSDVFVMDIALCGDEHEYYIIECGCMNTVGFYHSDIKKIVEEVTEYIKSDNRTVIGNKSQIMFDVNRKVHGLLNLNFYLGNKLISDEKIFIPSYQMKLELFLEKLKNDDFRDFDLEGLSNEGIFQVLEDKKEYDEEMYFNHMLLLDETIDQYIIFVTKEDKDIRFTWKCWSEDVRNYYHHLYEVYSAHVPEDYLILCIEGLVKKMRELDGKRV